MRHVSLVSAVNPFGHLLFPLFTSAARGLVQLGSGLFGLGLLVLILFYTAGCGGSSDGDASSSWQSQGISDSSFVKSVAIGSIYAAGASNDEKAKIWSIANGDSTALAQLSDDQSVILALLYKDNQLTVGYRDAVRGRVCRYDIASKIQTELNIPDAVSVSGMQFWNDSLIVSGMDANRNGGLWQYSSGAWYDISNSTALTTCDAVAVSDNRLFVAGQNATDESISCTYTTVLTYDGITWTDLQPEEKIPYVRAMLGDGSGGVYVGGENHARRGEVWRVSASGSWSTLNLPGAMEVRTLARKNDGTLVVGGTNNSYSGEVWTLDADGNWDTLGTVPSSWSVNGLGLPADGSVVAAGINRDYKGQVWILD
jgi:hypothetical protein